MVIVRKLDGTALLFVDFKAINAVTTPVPFYMPRVEEVLESIGKSCVIFKLDNPFNVWLILKKKVEDLR